MKNSVGIVLLVVFMINLSMGQQIDIISNWDTKTANWQNNNSLVKVENPELESAVNSTTYCGKIISTSNEYDLLLMNSNSSFDFSMFSTYRFKILPPATGGKVLLKFENADNTASFSEEVTPTPEQWNAYEFDFTNQTLSTYTRMVIFFDLGGSSAGNTWYIDEVEREGEGDTQVPTSPTDLTVSEISNSELRLSWAPAEDNSGIKTYHIYNNGELLKSTPAIYNYLSGLTPATTYSLTMKAEDIFGNMSELSQSIEATTLSGSDISAEVSSRFNYRLGTQSIGPDYQFTAKDKLIETAEVILAMGSNLLKISFGDTYGLGNLPSNLKDIAAESPSFRQVFDMDFTYYHLWAYGPSYWYDGQSTDESQAEYDAIYELTVHFLKTYSGTGKKFYLGNWEGDWHLVDDYNTPDIEWNTFRETLAPETVQGMIDWLNIRQKAVDDAKADTEYENVEVYHYVEVNLVRKSIDNNLPSIATKVLPFTNVDYVSYSCYDAISYDNTYEGVSVKLKEALDFIEAKLPAKAGLPEGKRVWLGEYGYPNGRNDFENKGYKDPTDEDQQDQQSRHVMKTSLEWGTPFVLYWELYNNEVVDGMQNGFWLINDKNEKQKIYYTHENFYQTASDELTLYKQENGREATATEAQQILIDALANSGNTEENKQVLKVKEAGKQLLIYPNPVDQYLTLDGYTGEVKVSDLNGKPILSQRISAQDSEVGLSHLETGVYLLILGGNKKSIRFIKK